GYPSIPATRLARTLAPPVPRLRGISRLLLLGLFVAGTATARAQTNYPFLNPDLPAEQRAYNAISLMTRDEKLDLLRFRGGVLRLGIKPLGSVEGLHGVAMGGPSNWGQR